MASLFWSSSDPEPLFRCPQPQSPAASEGGSDGSSKGEEAAACALGDAADGIAVTARPCRAAPPAWETTRWPPDGGSF